MRAVLVLAAAGAFLPGPAAAQGYMHAPALHPSYLEDGRYAHRDDRPRHHRPPCPHRCDGYWGGGRHHGYGHPGAGYGRGDGYGADYAYPPYAVAYGYSVGPGYGYSYAPSYGYTYGPSYGYGYSTAYAYGAAVSAAQAYPSIHSGYYAWDGYGGW